MVISPVVRGLFGLAWNVPANTLSVTPHLPADWQTATVHNIPFGATRLDLKFTRSASQLVIEATHTPAGLRLVSQSPDARMVGSTLRIPLPAVEVTLTHQLPAFGNETRQLKVLDQETTAHRCTLALAGIGGISYPLLLRENAATLHVAADGATLGPLNNGVRTVTVDFPQSNGYITKTVTFSW
jgi:hypothetical protein